MPGNFKGFRNSVLGPEVKDQILDQRMLLVLLSLTELQRVSGILGQELEAETNACISII